MSFPLQPLTENANGVIDTFGNFYPFIAKSDAIAIPNIRYYIREIIASGEAPNGNLVILLSGTLLGQQVYPVSLLCNNRSISITIPVHILFDSGTEVSIDATGNNFQQSTTMVVAVVDVRGINQ